MSERDIEKQPYTVDEARVAAFFCERGIGGGDDPIGSLMASHAYLAAERNELRADRDGLIAVLKNISLLKPEPIGDSGFVLGPLSLFNAAQRLAKENLKKFKR